MFHLRQRIQIISWFGGFEKKIRQGMMKLIYVEELSIEYIQDIKLFGKNIGGFKGPIVA